MNKWKIIQYNKRIEQLLVDKYHAKGKGLHSKLSSVEEDINPKLVKRIRYIATIRNKLVHDSDFNSIPKGFIQINKEVISELSQKKRGFFFWVFVILFIILLSILTRIML